jgi:hypothetical protein
MSSLLACTRSGTCQADATCHRPSRFQAQLDAAPGPGRARVHTDTEACTSHLACAIAAVTAWAQRQHLTSGHITVLALDPPPFGATPADPAPAAGYGAHGLAFSTIPLPGQPS